MDDIYEKTSLTPLRVARTSGYIDWESQPSKFKQYPEFLFRYELNSNIALKVVELSRKITSVSHISAKPYYRLNTPSAGNLHPIELYVQIRGVKGVLSGVYHVDSATDSLVLIAEIENDGIEHMLGIDNIFKGMIFLISCVPFRSYWKYGDRAFRYCYLDAGHQIGAIQASLTIDNNNATILSVNEADKLNLFMGFKDEEFVCSAVGVGYEGDKNVQELKEKLIHVSPTDYSQNSESIYKIFLNQDTKYTLLPIPCSIDEGIIKNRRSARKFSAGKIDKNIDKTIKNILNNPPEGLVCEVIDLKDDATKDKICDLLIGQSFVKNSLSAIVITSEYFNSSMLMTAGAFAHQLHLYIQSQNLGFSGIGAFYDKKLQKYIRTQNYILYVCVIGTI